MLVNTANTRPFDEDDAGLFAGAKPFSDGDPLISYDVEGNLILVGNKTGVEIMVSGVCPTSYFYHVEFPTQAGCAFFMKSLTGFSLNALMNMGFEEI